MGFRVKLTLKNMALETKEICFDGEKYFVIYYGPAGFNSTPLTLDEIRQISAFAEANLLSNNQGV